MKDNSIAHDSYFCQKYEGSVPFPTQRKNEMRNFVGAPYEMRMYFKKSFQCPKACRPKNHQETWVYC